jgi:hypothetical protein
MTDFFEAAARDGVFRFDGQILEIFATDGPSSRCW